MDKTIIKYQNSLKTLLGFIFILSNFLFLPGCSKKNPLLPNDEMGSREEQTVVPAVPTLVSPAMGVNNVACNITTQWNKSAGANYYEFQLTKDSTFQKILYDVSNIEKTYFLVHNLSCSTKYFWRVKALNNIGGSNWSSSWHFLTVLNDSVIVPLTAPILLAPYNNSVDVERNVPLVWQSLTSVCLYDLQVSTDSTFSAVLYNLQGLSEPQYQLNDLSYFKKYYWRVRATSNHSFSDWSQIRNFRTIGLINKIGSFETQGAFYDVQVIGKYAFLSDNYNNCIDVINIENPSTPNLVTSIPIIMPCEMCLYGNYLYVKNYSYESYSYELSIIDINDPTNPVCAGECRNVYSLPSSLSSGIAVYGNYAYVADQGCGIEIINISNPTNPQFIAAYKVAGCTYGDIVIVNGVCYVIDTNYGVRILSLSNPTAPTEIGKFPASLGTPLKLLANNNVLYFTENNYLRILDVSNLTNPILLNTYQAPNTIECLAKSGNHLYLHSIWYDLRAVDVTNPGMPVEVEYHTGYDYLSEKYYTYGDHLYTIYGDLRIFTTIP